MRFWTISLVCAMALWLSGVSRAGNAPAKADLLAQGTSAPDGGDAPAGYTVLAASDSGKSLIAEKANITSIKDAFEATFPDLATYFGTRLSIRSASQSIKDPTAGTATFTANPNGQALRGMISCKLRDGGIASMAIVYASENAPQAEWKELMHPPKPAVAAAAAPPVFTLAEYDFPDGTGSVGLAQGWTCNAQSGMDPVTIVGPENQLIFFATSRNINLPNSSIVRIREQSDAWMQQTLARSRQEGINPYSVAPMAPLLVAPLSDPLDELKTMMPQFSALSQFNHGPSMSIEKIICSTNAPSALEGGMGANITYDSALSKNGRSVHFRTQTYLQVAPLGQEAWFWFSKGITAPVEHFDRDQPLMAAMFTSIKLDADRLRRVAEAKNLQTRQFTRQWVEQYQQNMQTAAQQWQKDQLARNAAWQKHHEETQEGYDKQNAETAAALLDRQRNFDDQIEWVRGTVDLYDTQSGHGAVADANDQADIMDRLYRADMDPNTTVRIPLKDQIDPIPAR